VLLQLFTTLISNFDFDITVPNFNVKVNINKLKRNGRMILNGNDEPATIEVISPVN